MKTFKETLVVYSSLLLGDVEELQFEPEGNSAVAEAELKSSLGNVRRGEVEDGGVRCLILISFGSSAIFLSVLIF